MRLWRIPQWRIRGVGTVATGPLTFSPANRVFDDPARPPVDGSTLPTYELCRKSDRWTTTVRPP